MFACDSTLSELIAACVAQPDSRTPLDILTDYLEEQGDPRCELLRAYLALWNRAESLPTRGNTSRGSLEVKSFREEVSRLRHFACLCVRLTPLPGERRSWQLLTEERARKMLVMAELYQAELVTIGQLQVSCMTDVEARRRWITLAARLAAWTAKAPGSASHNAKLAADCTVLAIRDAVAELPGSERDPARGAAASWQHQLAALCSR